MPQIIVTADCGTAFGGGAVTLRERVSVEDFESQHFATQLVERLGWAVEDADRAEEQQAPAASGATEDRRQGVGDRRRDTSGDHRDVSEASAEVVAERVLA